MSHSQVVKSEITEEELFRNAQRKYNEFLEKEHGASEGFGVPVASMLVIALLALGGYLLFHNGSPWCLIPFGIAFFCQSGIRKTIKETDRELSKRALNRMRSGEVAILTEKGIIPEQPQG